MTKTTPSIVIEVSAMLVASTTLRANAKADATCTSSDAWMSASVILRKEPKTFTPVFHSATRSSAAPGEGHVWLAIVSNTSSVLA